jgi:hypothetical protein
MSRIGRYLEAFRHTDRGDAEAPGLIQDAAGDSWVILPDGTRERLGNGGSVPDPITASLNVQSPTGDTIANLEDETQSQGLYVASDGSVSINATGGGPGTGALSLLGGGFAQLLYIRGDGLFLVPANLPTADPHVANQLWNSAGTLKVSAG